MRPWTFAALVEKGLMKVGDGYRAKNSELGGSGLVFLRSAYLQDSGFRLDEPDRFLIREPEKFGDKVARHGDSVITTKGNSTGRVGYVNGNVEGAVYSPHLSYWRSMDPETIEPRFLYFWSRGAEFLDQLGGMAFSTDMAPYLSLRDQMRLEISLPEIGVQRDIASLLGALDDKIELNRRMSATLEEMARALYRSWFVDFDPVHARAAGQLPAHMDTPTAALFPDNFGPDGLPEGWDMSTIGEVAETVGGATPKTKEPDFWDGPHRWATPRDLSKLGGPILFETDRTLTDEGLAKISSGLSPAGTVLLSSRAPIGYVAIAQNPMAVNQGFIALRETDKISSVEAYFWVQANMDAILANANGSTFQEISKKNFRPLPCVVATGPVRNAFRELAGKWFDRVAGLSAESANLATLRDALLPRLMSGELRVREAEAQVEAVV